MSIFLFILYFLLYLLFFQSFLCHLIIITKKDLAFLFISPLHLIFNAALISYDNIKLSHSLLHIYFNIDILCISYLYSFVFASTYIFVLLYILHLFTLLYYYNSFVLHYLIFMLIYIIITL